MAINRFAILTDGFGEPATISGADWANKTGRALLITEGYLNRDIGLRVIGGRKSKFMNWMNFFYKKGK